jgi:hypothetical protein
MNIFKSEGAPFAVVILAGALGWYISTLQEALGDRLSLLYSFNNYSEDLLTLRIDNISRDKVFIGNFNIICIPPKKSVACLDLEKKPDAQYRIVEPYNLSNEVDPTTSPDGNIVKVNAWIPPSASIEIEFASSYPKSSYRFQYLPLKADNPEAMPVFYSAGVESFIIRNFDSLLIWTFVFSFLGLTAYALIQLIMLFFPMRSSNNDSPQVHDVTVQHHFFDGRPPNDG